MDVPTAIDSRLNVDGRLSESPLPTYDGVPVSSSLSRYVVSCWWEGAGVGVVSAAGEGAPARPPLWIPAPYRGTGQAFRRYDGWGAAPGFPPRIGVRGRLFAGMTDGGRPYGGTEGRERGWVPAFAGTTIGEPPLGSRPVSGTGQAFRGKDGWGVWLNVGHACWGGEGGAAPGWGA